jgi:hypothetical protein
MNGSIISWNPFTGLGKVSDSSGVYVFKKSDCSPGLQNALSNATIPPDAQISATYQVTAMNTAVNVDTT